MLTSYVCFDLETTGLSPETDEIIEIGAVKVIEGKVVDRFSRFVKPDAPISPMVEALTGISNAMVAEAGPTDRIIYDFLQFCGEFPVIGHNLMFDYRFTWRYAKKYYMEFDRAGGGYPADCPEGAAGAALKKPGKSVPSLWHCQCIGPQGLS